MNWLWAGITSAIIAWYSNKFIINYWGNKGTILVTPIIEETVKTAGALFFNGDIVFTHGAFGVIEAIYDVVTASRHGVLAALASFFGHLIFGMIAKAAYCTGHGFFVAVCLSGTIHLAWNLFVAFITRENWS